jgi:hypothetical protein
MAIETIRSKVLVLLETQRGTVDRINSTHTGVENLFSEYKILKDLELIQEQLDRIDKIAETDDCINLLWQIQYVLPFIVRRNPKLATILLN